MKTSDHINKWTVVQNKTGGFLSFSLIRDYKQHFPATNLTSGEQEYISYLTTLHWKPGEICMFFFKKKGWKTGCY